MRKEFQFYIVRLELFSALLPTICQTFQFYIVRLEQQILYGSRDLYHVSILYSAIRTVAGLKSSAINIRFNSIQCDQNLKVNKNDIIHISFNSIQCDQNPQIMKVNNPLYEMLTFAKLLFFCQKKCRCAIIIFRFVIDI